MANGSTDAVTTPKSGRVPVDNICKSFYSLFDPLTLVAMR